MSTVVSVAQADSRLKATAGIEFLPTNATVTVRGLHSADVVDAEDFDRGREWVLIGEIWKCGFLSSHQASCQASGTVSGAGSHLGCTSDVEGVCGKTYQVRSDAQIQWPFFDPGAPAASNRTTCQTASCEIAGTPGDTDQQECTECTSPVVIDLDGRGFRFTGLDQAVVFDIDADGRQETITWTAPGARMAFLVLDDNLNGRVDDGFELFGQVTPQLDSDDRNGFRALAGWDHPRQNGNGDGIISAEDWIFPWLLLWTDEDHDGVSQDHELLPLADHGIVALEFEPIVSNRRDRHGNVCRWTAMVHFEDHRRLAACDVLFLEQD